MIEKLIQKPRQVLKCSVEGIRGAPGSVAESWVQPSDYDLFLYGVCLEYPRVSDVGWMTEFIKSGVLRLTAGKAFQFEIPIHVIPELGFCLYNEDIPLGVRVYDLRSWSSGLPTPWLIRPSEVMAVEVHWMADLPEIECLLRVCFVCTVLEAA